MERLGKVTEWHDARGYGFIAALDDPTRRIFFHVRSYRLDGRRPEPGELVKFREGVVDGRAKASTVRRAGSARSAAAPSPKRPALEVPVPLQYALALVCLACVAWASLHERLPEWMLFAHPALSTVTWMAYALDKAAAGRGRQRIREANLHALEFAGGWPGAILAQHKLRHKTRKPAYRVVFWIMVTANIVAMAAWLRLRNGG